MISANGAWRQARRVALPSLSLAGYIGRLYFTRFLLVLTVLVLVLQMLDLLNRSEEILAVEGATRASLWQYVEWRLPELASRFAGFAALLASLFTLAGLGQTSEVTVMRGAGLSATQIMMPVLLVSFAVAVGHFMFHDRVTVPASERLAYWTETGYQPDAPLPPEGRRNIWLNDGNRVIEIGAAAPIAEGGALLTRVTVYRRAPGGNLTETIDADLAVFAAGQWTLHGVRRFDLDGHQLEALQTRDFELGFPLDRLFAELDRPDHAALAELSLSIATLRRAGMETFTLETSYYHRFAAALSTVILPLLGCFVAYGTIRASGRVWRIIIGMAVGFSYFVFDNYMVAMGGLGILPPLIAAAAAPLLYALAGASLLMRQE